MKVTNHNLPVVSIIINNYNYADFLRKAVDSALNQTYPKVEVVVVDDGSTDHSKEVIKSYGDKIISVLKQNGGQTSAGNAGFAASKGDIICFLDADDTFYPNKVEVIVDFFLKKIEQDSLLLVCHLLNVIDKNGTALGYTEPTRIHQDTNNWYEYARKYNFIPFQSSPTSGISITRQLAERLFPLPNDVYFGLDDFIVRPAALIGEIYGINQALGSYRIHGSNNWHGNPYMRDKKFLLMQEAFLNAKLRESNRQPVISFFDSLFSREYYLYNGCSQDLLTLAFKVLWRNPDLTTIKFFLTTLLMATRLKLQPGWKR